VSAYACDGCDAPAEELYEVDGDFYCANCSAGLVRLAMAQTGQLPRIFDTVPCPPAEEES
jgi:uncharacterized Zn finger protein (UPF0148 family)